MWDALRGSRGWAVSSRWWNPGERRLFGRDGSPAEPPPGEAHLIGSARSPRRHEKVVRHSRRQSSASPAQVSRSRACRAPPGEAHLIGSARSPRRHEKVVRHSRRQGSALPAQVSRSRACRPEVGVPVRDLGGWGSRGHCIFTATGPRGFCHHGRQVGDETQAAFERLPVRFAPFSAFPVRPAPSAQLGFPRATAFSQQLARVGFATGG